jgi:predicted Rdx family selenoprotein
LFPQFAQELLQTFSTTLGEVSLQPSSGGVFIVDITYAQPSSSDVSILRHRVLWDRAIDGGFPETKELKRRVRDVVEPKRDLGHVDRNYPRKTGENGAAGGEVTEQKKEGSTVLPRPGDIAAKAASIIHPQAQEQHESGTGAGDRETPGDVGGKKEHCEDCV